MIILNEYEFIQKIHWPSSVKIRLNGAGSQLQDWDLLKEIHTFPAQGSISSSGRTKNSNHLQNRFPQTHCVEGDLYLLFIFYNIKDWYQNATETSMLNVLGRITQINLLWKTCGSTRDLQFSDPPFIIFKWVTPLFMC